MHQCMYGYMRKKLMKQPKIINFVSELFIYLTDVNGKKLKCFNNVSHNWNGKYEKG